MTISPFVGVSNKFKHLKNVLFPDPDGPITQTHSPLSIWQSMPFNTSRDPKYLCKFLTSITLSQSPF